MKEFRIGIKIFILLNLIISLPTFAFNFNQSSATAYMNAATFPTALGDITSLASGTASVTANGWPNSTSKDLVRVESVTLASELSNRGFTLEVKVANSSWLSSTQAIGKCVWVDANCSTNGSLSVAVNNRATQAVSVRLKRNSLDSYEAIPNDTTIAIIALRQYGSGQIGSLAYLYFKFNGVVNPVVPTCDVKDFDNKVLLPTVKTTDLIGNGAGRYAKAKKPFTINLKCTDSPKVSVTFTGTIMGSNDEVLQNLESNNPNVGIQLEYVDNYSTTKTTVKNGTAFQVLQSAGTNETLNFNSYYYYKGGGSAVSGGLVKSNAEFLFTYQ